MFWLTASLAILVVTTRLASGQQITKCTFDESVCGCKTDQGYISLRQYMDKPLYAQDSSQGYEYHWNPCKDFTMGTVTAGCIQHLPNMDDYDCGTHKSTTTSVESGNAVFELKAADNLRISKITCVCKSNAVDVFELEGEFPPGTYDFQLTGDSCCQGAAPPSSSGKSDGLSPGSILLIIFLVAVVVYLVGGVAFQTGIRKAKGKESLPNINFWTTVPGLIKDGFRFTFSCGKQTSYQSI